MRCDIVVLKNVQKIYPNGFHALKNINLSVDKGDVYGIIGFSGAGKSTLIRLINLLEHPTSGSIVVDGKEMNKLNTKELRFERQKIGMIFQHFNLLSSKDVYGNIAFALEIAKWSKPKIKNRVEELLDLVELRDKINYYPSQLSGGQKQRVAIARALANNPKLLLCDEATSALDSKTTKSILKLIRDLKDRLNLSVVLITHQMEVVKEVCNKMCVISDGEIVEQGIVEDVFINPKNSVTKELISFLPPISSDEIINTLKDGSNIYKVTFNHNNALSPIISGAIKNFDIDINILSGSIEAINTGEIGYLVLKFIGEEYIIKDCIDWLILNGVRVEYIDRAGYDG